MVGEKPWLLAPTSKAGAGRDRPPTVVNEDLREDGGGKKTRVSQFDKMSAIRLKLNPAQTGPTNKVSEIKEDPGGKTGKFTF